MDPKIVQRVTKNLGLNRSSDKEEVYQYIENVLGVKEKRCSRGGKRTNAFGLRHEGPNPLPIRNFNLLHAHKRSDGTFDVRGKGLQSACIICDHTYRHGRLDKWTKFYSTMTDDEVRAHYIQNYGPTARCSSCKQQKDPREFMIVRGMERGLHNKCFACVKEYTESVGSRWIIFSPDGRNTVSVVGTACTVCGATKDLHKDHIWPLAKGGTDLAVNIQILCKKHNLEKSDSIRHIRSISEIAPEMICARYRDVLVKAKRQRWPIAKFELEMSRRVREFIRQKQQMSGDELGKFFAAEKVRNNRKHGVKRAVQKFRKYAGVAVLDIDSYIEENKKEVI